MTKYAPNLKSRDSGGTSPVFHAESKNALKILLDTGLDVNATNENGTTPLMWAARFGDFETAQILLDYGAKVNWKSKPGFTPLLDSILGDNPKIVELFLERGASANEKFENDLSGSTALGFAVSRNQLAVDQILLANGADPNFKYKDGSTYLMDATYHKNLELVNILLANNANPNIKKDNGESALKMAYEQPFKDEGVRKKIIKVLLSAGAKE